MLIIYVDDIIVMGNDEVWTLFPVSQKIALLLMPFPCGKMLTMPHQMMGKVIYFYFFCRKNIPHLLSISVEKWLHKHALSVLETYCHDLKSGAHIFRVATVMWHFTFICQIIQPMKISRQLVSLGKIIYISLEGNYKACVKSQLQPWPTCPIQKNVTKEPKQKV